MQWSQGCPRGAADPMRLSAEAIFGCHYIEKKPSYTLHMF